MTSHPTGSEVGRVSSSRDNHVVPQRGGMQPRGTRPLYNDQISNCSVIRTGNSRHSNKRTKSQSRQDRWRSNQASLEQKRKYRSFVQGYRQFQEKCTPLDSDIEEAMLRNYQQDGMYDPSSFPRPIAGSPPSTMTGDADRREMDQLVSFLQEGGVGYMPSRKSSGWVRLMFENWNSLGVFTQGWKIDRINQLIRDLQVDIVAGCECQCNWDFVPPRRQFLQLLSPGSSTVGVASHNSTETINRDQMGGTAIAAVGRLSDVVTEVGSDNTGLARWSWIRIGATTRSTRVVCGYLPCKPGKAARGHTVWEQHCRYFQARGDFRCPSAIFVDDLAMQLATWRSNGEEIILCIDANQDVYRGSLATRLSQPDVQLHCLMESAMGEPVPNSHFRGKSQISTIFAVTGWNPDMPCATPTGDYPTIARPKSRSLTCKISRIRRKYCATLHRLVDRHNMDQKLELIDGADGTLPSDAVLHMHNKWDKEMGDFMRHAERACTRFKSSAIEYSPTVGQWLKRRAVLKWILRWHDGKVPDPRNLCRAAKRANIANPLSLTKIEVQLRLHSCLEHLFELKERAPTLRKKHLQWRLKVAKQQEDEEASTEILRIIKHEANRQRQRNINRVVKDTRGRSVLSVGVSTEAGSHTYTDQQEVEQVCGQHLGARFSLGSRAPLSANELLREIGNLSDTEAAKQILSNTYNFSETWDTATVDLLKASARIRLDCGNYPQLTNDISTQEYQDFWSRSKEATSSSKSGRHFGHYRAITENPDLVSLQVKSINLVSRRGTPLDRWRQGVTVLLEKVAGNNRIDKLRAICLLEADFNWWLKVHFARRMTHRMRATGALPLEQGATSGKTAMDSSLAKQLFFDQANVLHHCCAVTSTDAANCYDAVNHAAGSFVLQAMSVPINIVKCYLLCVQTMRFFLKTGFGMAKQSYGGSNQNPYMGLVQGSGAAPAAWTAISTVMLAAYKFKGYGAFFASAWSGILLGIAAILYVDDTDLLHMTSPNTSEASFFQQIQEATTYWAYLLQATGGNLKPEKCYWYFLTYKFVQGKPLLKPLRDISHYDLCIPQPGAPSVSISLKDSGKASEVLGVWASPSGLGTSQLDHMLAKGRKWSRRVLHSALRPSEVWHSFRTQALPSVRYGLLVLMNSPKEVDDAFGSWYYTLLPSLGVNRNIAREWRTLPKRHQGLGLPQMSLEKLALSLQYLHRHWGRPTPTGKMLRSVFELVQIEVGLSGNFLKRDFRVFGGLATHTWYKVLWEYSHLYDVTIELPEVDVPLVRQGDKVLMEEVVKLVPATQWESINRARRFYKVYFMSQLVLCDGCTVDPTKIQTTKCQHMDSKMRFPVEMPTRADLRLWRDTIALLTSSTFRLSPRLGKHLRATYDLIQWRTDKHNHHVARLCVDAPPALFVRGDTRYSTRGRQTYELCANETTIPECPYVASVNVISDTTVSVHSQSLLMSVTRGLEISSLRQALGNLPCCDFLRGLELKDDGPWLIRALERGSLVACHDGSYMPTQDNTRCSAATLFLCTHTGKIASATYCERTQPEVASNYRGELIGGVTATIILRALSLLVQCPVHGTVEIYCDNMGVVLHGNSRHRTLPERQTQSDLILLLRHNLDLLECDVRYVHVYGHLDDQTSFDQLTLPQQLNVMADKLAKECLLAHIAQKSAYGPYYPGELLDIRIGGRKATNSIRDLLYETWGTKTAIPLFARRNIVCRYHYSKIAWDHVGRAMEAYPQMFNLWVTKHVSGFSGTNKQLSRYDGTTVNRCPCCGHNDESTAHITRCLNPGRQRIFQQSVDTLLDWMERTHCDVNLIECLEQYLSLRGEGSMTLIAAPFPRLSQWAMDMDLLGWDNFLEGRICSSLLTYKRQHLHDPTHADTFNHGQRSSFILSSESLTNNGFFATLGCTFEHRYLLDLDFMELGMGSTTNRQYWIVTLESAIKAFQMLPLSLLKSSTTLPLLVELKSGTTYNGRLLSCDTYMNLNLADVVCTSKDGDQFWKLTECYVRGSSIKYLRLPEEAVERVGEEEGRWKGGGGGRGRGRGGRESRGGRGRGRGRSGGRGGRGRGQGQSASS
ncbi:hypothetical protein HJC23_000229 [Cyclotella cryptica]|uniref:Sm domain-containing protein n=1 Tax=Cyclotella cryptica TaxID=29204 RepID=A0ABD3PLR4_9STRA